MSAQAIAVELNHGRIKACDGTTLPEKARATLIIRFEPKTGHDPLKPHPEFGKAVFYEDPSKPLDPEDWPEAFQ